MTTVRQFVFALLSSACLVATGCTPTPKMATSLRHDPTQQSAVQPPIETMLWDDSSLSCEQIKARYDALAPFVKNAGLLIPPPAVVDVLNPGTSAITFLPLFGPMIAIGMDSAAREQAARDAARVDPDGKFAAAMLAHQRGHEAIDRRQYLVYLATQKGCR